jgi:outer membrane protein assembly factor BamB
MCLASRSRAADWPQFRADAGRTGYTSEQLPAKLQLAWTYRPAHPPRISWPNEPKILYDHAFNVVVAGGLAYFGSSADCGVHALDAGTGAKKWSFYTGGPVRCAPAAWKDRLFAASDDGHLYCLDAESGKLVWKKRAGPGDDTVLGNGAVISKWPARGGPAVADGVVYFAAGVWPADGTYVYALKAETGEKVWCNGTAGEMVRPHPHAGGFKDKSGVGFQGHVAVGKDVVLVPTGRSLAAAFCRATGKAFPFKIFSNGGATVATVDGLIFDGGYVFASPGGKMLSRGVNPRAVAVSPDLLIHSGVTMVTALGRKAPFCKTSGKKWATGNNKAGGAALIVAGKTVYSAGRKRVVAIDGTSKSITWSADLDGEPRSLAASGGRLLISTSAGTIYCFDAAGGGRVVEEKPAAGTGGGSCAGAAAEILEKSGVKEGYCLDLGCGDGSLALELARRSKLHIVGVEKDPTKVAEARRKLAAAGLYGARVSIHQGDPERMLLPRHFANLIVSQSALTGTAPDRETFDRLQRPWGGVVCIGKPGAMKPRARGPLEGAGQWTHQYASPAGTSCSGDKLVRGPLTVRWFGGPDMDMPNRHGRAPAPLFFEGRLFVQGMDALRALDAYNGRLLWEVPFKDIGKPYDGEHLLGTAGTHGTLCAAPEGVFVRHGDKCVRLDAATGKKLAEFTLPGKGNGQRVWGFVASEDGVLLGTEADTTHNVPYYYGKADMSRVFTESKNLFAMDAATGKLLWEYRPEKSVRNNTVTIAGGRLYLVDRVKAEEQPRYKKLAKPHAPGKLLALDTKTGKEVWSKSDDIWGTVLLLSPEHDVLLMSGQPAFKGFGLTSDQDKRIAAFKASNGTKLWETGELRHIHRPVIVDKTIYLSRGKLDLLTGKALPGEEWRISRSHGCGPFVAGARLLLFRSAVLGYIDVKDSRRTQHFGGIRPGCWINAIPAGGMILMPEFSEKCSCAYLNKTTLALEALER